MALSQRGFEHSDSEDDRGDDSEDEGSNKESSTRVAKGNPVDDVGLFIYTLAEKNASSMSATSAPAKVFENSVSTRAIEYCQKGVAAAIQFKEARLRTTKILRERI